MIDFEQFKFSHEFRDYQKRALDEVHQYIQDGKIHIVAAPGAGKTILALQLLMEIKKNTLILVPTIALREQWIERFRGDFANGQDVSGVIGNDLSNAKAITVITYQSLHSTYKEDGSKIIDSLGKQEIGLVILDEAHHLKASWYQTLDKLLGGLKDVKTISLTATPPYDVSNNEWKKYLEICGEIDTEIMIPELVKEGNLCPHQDYVYFNFPTEKQLLEIEKYREERKELFTELCNSNELVTAISLNPGIISLDEHIDFFLNNFEYYISILSFLKYRGVPVANQSEKQEAELPKFNIRHMEIILTNCLFTDKNSYKDFVEYFKEVKRKLNEIGAIHESKVYLVENQATKKLITQNIGKLNSINEIIVTEYQALQKELKMVVVTDYIREDIYEVQENTEINVIGAVPIFKSIRNELKDKVNIAVLTGRMVIIPTNMQEALRKICHQRKLTEVEVAELAYDFEYCQVWFGTNSKKYMVSIITELFENNDIQVLIGTGALIGEGWDAPFINTLIMATFISSFVTSNQIRGRAIRTNKNDANKVANVWHLVCLERINNKAYGLGVDYDVLKRRFETFDGVHMDEVRIGRGIERLGIDYNEVCGTDEIGDINDKMTKAALARSKVNGMWQEALESYIPVKRGKIVEEDCNINIAKQHKAEKSKKLIKVGAMLVSSGAFFATLLGQNVIGMLISAGIVAGLVIQRWWQGKEPYLVNKFARALLLALVEIEIIEQISKVVVEQEASDISFYMEKGSTIEKSRYNNCLKEMLSPIEVPRYLIKIKRGYYQVPALIGKNKKWVQILEKYLRKEFFKVESLYTKTSIGKRQLLKIKRQMFAKR